MQSLIPRIVIGASVGYLVGLFFTALSEGDGAAGAIAINYAAAFETSYPLSELNRPMLVCVAVGSVMGWA